MSSPDALDTAGLDLTLADTQAIDDCWNRIGIHGDKSCPLLADHIHCRNCAVYSAAATRLLDRYALQQDDHRRAAVELDQDIVTRSLLMFRLGEEWLGIATRCLVEVAPLQPIHSLPHQRSRALLGVANVRGALVACLSLVELLGLDAAGTIIKIAKPVAQTYTEIANKNGIPVEEASRARFSRQDYAPAPWAQASARSKSAAAPFRSPPSQRASPQRLIARDSMAER